jgi:hypothetical protein
VGKKLTDRQLVLKIDRLVKRYGKVRLVSQDASYDPPCDCMCKSCKNRFLDGDEPDMRRRLIDKKGNCVVSYKSDGHKKWSGFSQSCFMDNYWDDLDCNHPRGIWGDKTCKCEPKKTVKKTMGYLLDHDRDDLMPIIIEYGKRFSKKVKL